MENLGSGRHMTSFEDSVYFNEGAVGGTCQVLLKKKHPFEITNKYFLRNECWFAIYKNCKNEIVT